MIYNYFSGNYRSGDKTHAYQNATREPGRYNPRTGMILRGGNGGIAGSTTYTATARVISLSSALPFKTEGGEPAVYFFYAFVVPGAFLRNLLRGT